MTHEWYCISYLYSSLSYSRMTSWSGRLLHAFWAKMKIFGKKTVVLGLKRPEMESISDRKSVMLRLSRPCLNFGKIEKTLFVQRFVKLNPKWSVLTQLFAHLENAYGLPIQIVLVEGYHENGLAKLNNLSIYTYKI